MPIDTSSFVDLVRESGPQLDLIVREHLDEYDGEVLLHLLTADLRRFAEAAFEAQRDQSALQVILELMDRGLAEGDDAVSNAVAVSFVEDIAWWEPAAGPFLDTWPTHLRGEVDELRRQATRDTAE